MADANRMVFLGFGKYARADKIYAIEPIRDERRGHGRRTLVWVEGVSEPIVASRTERTILADMGQGPQMSSRRRARSTSPTSAGGLATCSRRVRTRTTRTSSSSHPRGWNRPRSASRG